MYQNLALDNCSLSAGTLLRAELLQQRCSNDAACCSLLQPRGRTTQSSQSAQLKKEAVGDAEAQGDSSMFKLRRAETRHCSPSPRGAPVLFK